MSNEELYGRMRQQRMLREELRDKKKELEDMMRKEHSLKHPNSLRNQDTQSDVVSYSNKSDVFGSVSLSSTFLIDILVKVDAVDSEWFNVIEFIKDLDVQNWPQLYYIMLVIMMSII